MFDLLAALVQSRFLKHRNSSLIFERYRCTRFSSLEFDPLSDPEGDLRREAEVHGKNITQGLDMFGNISSSPGALSSSFISKSESHSAQPL
jgi:hypothetical protein